MKAGWTTIWVILVWVIIGASCKPDDPNGDLPSNDVMVMDVPRHFPAVPVPADNPLTPAKVALGKMLFFDHRLSLDSSLNCASCHLPDLAFSDPRRISLGVNNAEGTRNAPALINVAYGRSFFWDGSNPALETQVIFPITADFEMHMTTEEMVRRLNSDPEYVRWFKHVFNKAPDADGTFKAISAFERTLLSYNSKWDRFMLGDSSALNPQEKRGWLLFNTERAECFHCHGGFNFTDEDFHNNGLYTVYEDDGRWRVTGSPFDRAKFKSPTLRNIALTAPYMHDGSLNSLEEVVAHYASRGRPHPNRSVFLPNIQLTPDEQADIVAFLHALTDTVFTQNPEFRP